MLTAAVDPAYQAATDRCIDAERATVATAKLAIDQGAPRASTIDAADRALVPVRAACDRVIEGFERIRLAQLAAVRALDQGELAAAQAALESARKGWAELTSK